MKEHEQKLRAMTPEALGAKVAGDLSEVVKTRTVIDVETGEPVSRDQMRERAREVDNLSLTFALACLERKVGPATGMSATLDFLACQIVIASQGDTLRADQLTEVMVAGLRALVKTKTLRD